MTPTATDPSSSADRQPVRRPGRRRGPTGRAVDRLAALDTRAVLVVILVVAGLVRLGGAWSGTPCTITDDSTVAAEATAEGRCVSYNDSVTYVTDARLNADGEWFHTQEGDDPPVDTALHAPLFSVVLTPLLWLGIEGYEGLRYAVALLGVLAVGAIFLLGREVAGRVVGLVAAGVAAVHPLIWVNDVVLMPEGLFAAAVAAVSVLAYRFHDHPTTGRAAALGAAIGGAGLLRNEALLAVGFIVLPLVLGMHRVSWAERARRAAVVAGALALVLAPWVAFNWSRFDRPLLTNGVGAGVRVGTCDETFYNDRLLGLRSIDCLEVDGDELRAPENDDEIGRSRVFLDGATAYYRDNLGRVPSVVLARVSRFWGAWRPFESVRLDDAIEQRGAQRAQVGVLVGWVLLLPGAWGAVVLWRRRVPLSPLLGWVGVATVLAAANQPLQRFRISGDVALVVLAAVGLVAGWRSPVLRRAVGAPVADPDREAEAQSPMASPPSTGTTAPVR